LTWPRQAEIAPSVQLMTISEDQDPLRYVQWMLGRLHSSMATASNVPSSFSPSLAAVYAFVQSPDMDARSAFVRSVLLLAMSRFSLDRFFPRRP
jgi:hypothetical protein